MFWDISKIWFQKYYFKNMITKIWFQKYYFKNIISKICFQKYDFKKMISKIWFQKDDFKNYDFKNMISKVWFKKYDFNLFRICDFKYSSSFYRFFGRVLSGFAWAIFWYIAHAKPAKIFFRGVTTVHLNFTIVLPDWAIVENDDDIKIR